MRILALDTSTWWGGAALLERRPSAAGIVTVAELAVQLRDTHAEWLVRGFDRLLELAGWDRSAIDGYVATHGPGSFTGIRVGLGTVIGLGLASGRPCTALSSLAAVAEAHGPAAAGRMVVMAAGRGEMYGALYDAHSSPPELLDGPWLDAPARLRRELDRAGRLVIVPAPGSEPLLRQAGPEGRAACVAAAPRSIAAAAGRLALLGGFPERPADPGALAPVYLRPPDAEAQGPSR